MEAQPWGSATKCHPGGTGWPGREGVWGRQGGTRPGPSPLTLPPSSAQPGAVVSSSPCETCRCEVPGIPQADRFMIRCETQTCNTHCPVVSARCPHCSEPPGSSGRPGLRLHAHFFPTGLRVPGTERAVLWAVRADGLRHEHQ